MLWTEDNDNSHKRPRPERTMFRVRLPLLLILGLLPAAGFLSGCRPAGYFARRTPDVQEYSPEIPAASARPQRHTGGVNPLAATAWEKSADAAPDTVTASPPPATAALTASQPVLVPSAQTSSDTQATDAPAPFSLQGTRPQRPRLNRTIWSPGQNRMPLRLPAGMPLRIQLRNPCNLML
ncbi:MAG UNVERIFIED_CONTAM: hypothetical protein LVR18_50060 [Planctomycetaceae bacterium]